MGECVLSRFVVIDAVSNSWLATAISSQTVIDIISKCDRYHKVREYRDGEDCTVVRKLAVIFVNTYETAVEFHSHGDVSVPALRMDPHVSRPDGWDDSVGDHGVSVTVATESLNHRETRTQVSGLKS